eukprot:s378_g38.t1
MRAFGQCRTGVIVLMVFQGSPTYRPFRQSRQKAILMALGLHPSEGAAAAKTSFREVHGHQRKPVTRLGQFHAHRQFWDGLFAGHWATLAGRRPISLSRSKMESLLALRVTMRRSIFGLLTP